MVDVAQLGIRVDSSQALKAVADLDKLAIAGAKAEAATDDLGVSTGRAAPAMSKMGGKSRMLAQQLSQVAQQSAATGNVMQAVAIQAADIGLAFGTAGAILGTVATIALPALTAALGSFVTQAVTTKEAIDQLKASQDALRATQDILTMTVGELRAEYGLYAEQVRAAATALADLQVAEAQAQLAETVTQGAGAIDRYAVAIENLGQKSAAAPLLNLTRELGVTQAEARNLAVAFDDLRDAVSFEDRIAALANIDRLLKQSGVSAEKLPSELRKALIEGRQAEIAMAALKKEAADAAKAAAAIAANAPDAGFLSGAISDAATLASKLWEAAAAAAAAAGGESAVRAGATGANGPAFEGGRMGASSGSSLKDTPTIDSYFPSGGGSGGGGGGGGGTDPYAGNLQSLIESLRTEREIEDEWYQENLTILEDRRAQEILGKEAHDAAMIDLHQEYARRIAEIDSASQSERLGCTADFFGAMASVAQAGGGKMAKIAATFAAVEGTVNAYRAALQAMADPTIPFWGKAAAYASVLAAGLKGVQAIRAAGGGGGGGSVASQGAIAAPAAQDRLIIQGVRPDDIFTGQMLYDMLTKESKMRGSPIVELLR